MNDRPPLIERMLGYFLFLTRTIVDLLANIREWVWGKTLEGGEAVLGAGGSLLPYPPIFIIGAPRSGSTLLYQLLVERYKVGYLSNVHCQHHRGPAFAEFLLRPLRRRKPPDYSSNFGFIEGDAAPSECGEFWYRFFRRKPMAVSMRDADPRAMKKMRRAVRALVRVFGRPILIKNMNCALRLEPILLHIPEALFIVTHRKVEANASSILNARKEKYGDIETWYSLEPPGFEAFLNTPPEEQVHRQIESIYAEIEMARAKGHEARFLDITYQSVCENPLEVLAKIETFIETFEVKLEIQNEVPVSFVYQDEPIDKIL